MNQKAMYYRRMYRSNNYTKDDICGYVTSGVLTLTEAEYALQPTIVHQRISRILQQRDAALAAMQGFVAEGKLDESDLGGIPEVFIPWSADEQVKPGNLRVSRNMVYQCIQAHSTQADWRPEQAPSLWRKLGSPEEAAQDEWPAYIKPTGAHDAYQVGSKVTFEGTHYASVISGNVWTPVEYPAGWRKET